MRRAGRGRYQYVMAAIPHWLSVAPGHHSWHYRNKPCQHQREKRPAPLQGAGRSRLGRTGATTQLDTEAVSLPVGADNHLATRERGTECQRIPSGHHHGPVGVGGAELHRPVGQGSPAGAGIALTSTWVDPRDVGHSSSGAWLVLACASAVTAEPTRAASVARQSPPAACHVA